MNIGPKLLFQCFASEFNKNGEGVVHLELGYGCVHVRPREEDPEEICSFCTGKIGFDIMGMVCDHWNWEKSL